MIIVYYQWFRFLSLSLTHTLVAGIPYNVTIAAVNVVGVGEECTVVDFVDELCKSHNQYL